MCRVNEYGLECGLQRVELTAMGGNEWGLTMWG